MKEDVEFSKHQKTKCKQCFAKYMSEWSAKNKEKVRAIAKRQREKHKESISEGKKKCYYAKRGYYLSKMKEYEEKNHEHLMQYRKEYYIKNKDKILAKNRVRNQKPKAKLRINEVIRMKYRNNVYFRISDSIRKRLRLALKWQRQEKRNKTIDYLGCSINEFIEYFESKFINGMTMNKFMNGEIHIDHIKPCASFDLSDLEQQKECFHYTNLQPLWAKENFSKGTKSMEVWLCQPKSMIA